MKYITVGIAIKNILKIKPTSPIPGVRSTRSILTLAWRSISKTTEKEIPTTVKGTEHTTIGLIDNPRRLLIHNAVHVRAIVTKTGRTTS